MSFKDSKQGLFIFLAFILLISGCVGKDKQSLAKTSRSELLMGTVVSVDVCHDGTQSAEFDKAFEETWTQLKNMSIFLSSFDERSDVHKINYFSKQKIAVSRATYEVIEEAQRVSKITNGVFDITIGPLIELWHKSAEQNAFPSEESIVDAKEMVGVDKISLLKNNYIHLEKQGVRVDLGGIAKGYAIDQAAKALRKNGFNDFLIDAGGDIYAGGHNCKRDAWRVGIRDPRDKEKILKVVHLVDAAVTTSGDYERYYEIKGERWSHIINPITGYPQRGVVSATVIAPNATIADGLSTALCVLDGARGAEIINSLGDDFAGIVILSHGDGKLVEYKSAQFPHFEQPQSQ